MKNTSLQIVNESYQAVPRDLVWALEINESYSRSSVREQVKLRKQASLDRLKIHKKEIIKKSLKLLN